MRFLSLRMHGIIFMLAFVLPLSILTIYLYMFASDRFGSSASVIITEERASASPIDLSLLGLTNSASDRDAYVLQAFIESPDMLRYLDERLKLRQHYSDKKWDWWARLPSDASFEEFHDYFLSYMTVYFDADAKALIFSVQTFDRTLSKRIVEAVLERSQDFIDRLNERVTNEQLRFFDNQIKVSEARLTKERDRLLDFQKKNRLLTTEDESKTVIGTIAGLETALAQKESDLNARLKVLDKNAPQLVTLQLEISALRGQIAREKERLAGSGSSSLSDLDSRFREIQFDLEFVANIYKANLSALEQAKIEAARRLKFLIVVSQATLADESEYPDRTYILVTGIIFLMMSYFMIGVMVSIAREHV